jgi:hypothetical protein
MMRAVRLTTEFAAIAVFSVVAITAGGQDGPAKKRTAKPVLTVEQQETPVLQFVAENHAELEPLLESLKEHSPQQYGRAIRDLYRVQQKLATLRERDADRYKLEVKIWQTKSRAQLIAAKLAVADSASLQLELEKTVAKHLKLRGQLLRRDRRRQQDRLKKLNEQIEDLAGSETLDREVQGLLRTVRRHAQQRGDKKKTEAASTSSAKKKSK